MTHGIQVQHDTQMVDIVEQLRRQGYDVSLEPRLTDLPFDLGGYRPDILARRGQGGLFIEVKGRADRLSFERFQSIAAEVKRHPGWRFLLVTSQDISAPDLLAIEGDQATWNEIGQRVEHAHALLAQGDSETAYVMMWIAFERLLRLQATQVNLPIDLSGCLRPF
ncbi:MAG: hypothetical protein OHK0012_09730 [Synechococcales cyanobacterium]